MDAFDEKQKNPINLVEGIGYCTSIAFFVSN